ncbi:hypothetical protein ACP3TD_11550 [Pseudarthrobacter sp. 1G09]|uniref:hypothetical protein n=1 Tax=Pseudarthrobacter sp. 1G09 TaxID=3416178 RepID=UPI003CFA4AB7
MDDIRPPDLPNDSAAPLLEDEPGTADTEPIRDEDASCCLLFQGGAGVSSGRYLPHGYTLTLKGSVVAEHHLTLLHEIHHKVLNDDTAWGSLIRFAAEHPGWNRGLLGQLVATCRVVHEAFASFMSASYAELRHENVDEVMDAYPIYRPLMKRMDRLLTHVPEGHRKDIAATAVARFCMSPPVLTLVTDVYPRVLTLADIPSAWLPDQRFSRFGCVRPETITDAVNAADADFLRTHGQPIDALTLDNTDDLLEAAWKAWEETFINSVVSANSRLRELPNVPTNDHLPGVANLVHAATSRGVPVSLTHDSEERVLSDAESVQRILSATELRLRDEAWPSGLAEIGADVASADVLGLSAAGPVPFLLIHGRTPAQLSSTFAFVAADPIGQEDQNTPIFAVRLLVDHAGQDLILNATIPTPDAYRELAQAWPEEYLVANCITASCFTNTKWQKKWLPTLNSRPTVVLLDIGFLGTVGPGRLLGAGSTVYGAYMGLADPTMKALILHVEGHSHVILAIADDLSIQLLAGQLEDLLGERLVMRDADWSEWMPVLSAVCASVLGTESSLRFNGLAS